MSKGNTTSAPADYMAMVRRFPLRPLASEAEYDAAWELAEPLTGRTDLTPGQQMYLDALSFFLERYEEQHHAVKQAPGLTPAALLRELMDLRGMSVTDLGRVIGSQPMASMILRGTRGISKANIGKLAAHFRVDPAAFMPPAAARRALSKETRRRMAG